MISFQFSVISPVGTLLY